MAKRSKDDGAKKRPAFLNASILPVLPYIEMKSNREVLVDGCKAILEYDQEIIRINTGNLVISFVGRGLNIKCLTVSSIVIEGFITKVEFSS